jgi:8-oxo-dGTP pyrophosphatase MutT (NUDIX family)
VERSFLSNKSQSANLMLKKVTAFVLRKLPSGSELLVLEHPFAGIQLPAGTVNPGESPHNAVVREVAEEAGLKNIPIGADLGHRDTIMPPDRAVLIHPTKVFSRPDPNSFDWIEVSPGLWLDVHRRLSGYAQITYKEPDQLPNPTYTTYQITGWVPEEVLSQRQRRFFFLLNFSGQTPPSWKVNSDNHTYTLSWAPLTDLPELTPPQDEWLSVLDDHLNP